MLLRLLGHHAILRQRFPSSGQWPTLTWRSSYYFQELKRQLAWPMGTDRNDVTSGQELDSGHPVQPERGGLLATRSLQLPLLGPKLGTRQVEGAPFHCPLSHCPALK